MSNIFLRAASSAPIVALGILLSVGSSPVSAACFEDGVGCTHDQYIPTPPLQRLSCQSLWMVRNTIFDENGYCFSTSRARNAFSNDDCFISDQASVPLNNYERSNVAKIVKLEKQRGCP